MTTCLEPYPQYKDSGAPLLGSVPSHWQVKAVRRVATLNPSKSEISGDISDDELATFLPMEAVGTNGTVDSRRLKPIAELRNGFTYFKRGDVIVAKITPCFENGKGAYLGDLATSIGFGSTEFHVLRPTHQVDPRYLYLMTTLHSFRTAGGQNMIGSAGQKRVPVEFLGNYVIPVPPLDEQRAIARFLDRQDRRINRFIRAKRRMIELLNEQKQAIILQAVTRGLDSNVPLKPSGIDWLGDIPAHWERVRLGRAITRIEQGWSPQCEGFPAGSGEWGVLKVGCVNRGTLNDQQNKKLPNNLEPVPYLEIRDGDILVSRANTKELVGLAALATKPRERLMLCDKLFRFRSVPHLADSQFLVYVVRSRSSRAQIETSTNGASSSMQNIGQAVIAGLWIPLPPLLEQKVLVDEIETRTRQLSKTIERTANEIDLVREYRTRLIADVVTGKLDVRNHPDAQERVEDDVDDVSVLLDDVVDDLTDEFETEEDDSAVAD